MLFEAFDPCMALGMVWQQCVYVSQVDDMVRIRDHSTQFYHAQVIELL